MVLSALVTLVITLGFARLGAWLILPFAGIELLAPLPADLLPITNLTRR